jgi:chromosome segregation ATPase
MERKKRPRSRLQLPTQRGASAIMGTMATWPQAADPSGVAMSTVEDVQAAVAFERAFSRGSRERAQSAELGEKHWRRQEGQVASLRRKCERLESANHFLQNEADALAREPNGLEQKRAGEKLRVQNLEQNVASLKKESRRLQLAERQLAMQRDAALSAQKQLESQLEESSCECERLRKRMRAAGDAGETASASAQRQAKETRDLAKKLLCAQDHITALQKANSQSKHDLKAATQVNSAVTLELEQARTSLGRVKSKYDELCTKYTQSTAELREYTTRSYSEIGTQADGLFPTEAAAYIIETLLWTTAKQAGKNEARRRAKHACLKGVTMAEAFRQAGAEHRRGQAEVMVVAPLMQGPPPPNRHKRPAMDDSQAATRIQVGLLNPCSLAAGERSAAERDI